MALRASIVLGILAAAVAASFAASDSRAITLRSQRRNLSVSVTPPGGFGGPAYHASRRFDFFSFGHGKEPAACYLKVRFDAYTNEPGDRHSPEDVAIHWNSTPLAKIREQYKREFQNPSVEDLATVMVAGAPARVHAVYNADGHFYAAEIRRSSNVISFELRSPSRRELERHRQSFLSFVHSLRIP
jgi:hypothetical protein